MPAVHHETVVVKRERLFADLALSEMRVRVDRCENLRPPAGHSEADMKVYVACELAHPADTDGQRLQTDMVKGSASPVFDHHATWPIQRRAFVRYARRRGLTLHVYQDRAFAVLRKPILLGTALLKLSALAGACEVRATVPVMDGRRATGGSVTATVQLRTPLECDRDIASHHVRWVFLADTPTQTPPAPSHVHARAHAPAAHPAAASASTTHVTASGTHPAPTPASGATPPAPATATAGTAPSTRTRPACCRS